jgi:hypothetical protein
MNIILAKRRFNEQRNIARQRDIQFLLSFNEWVTIWNNSGYWDQRGRGVGKYCMSRKGDTGPYSIDNVFIQLSTQNTKDAFSDIDKLINANKKRSEKTKGISKPHKSVEHGKKISESLKNQIKYSCHNCNKLFGIGNLKRWHNDNCKTLSGETI